MNYYNTDYLEHHGILGQKWGVRRYQNRDGSLTPAGRKRIYAQGADGGYESRRNRFKRSVQGAKYEEDLAKNQTKLSKAYIKGNEKKIAKYELANKKLQKNKDIMLKDLSENEIKQGQDYIAVQKATRIGGIVAGVATMKSRGTQKTQDAVNKEEATRRAKYENKKTEEQKWWDEYQKKRDSFKTDEEKDRWQEMVEKDPSLVFDKPKTITRKR